MAILCDRTSNFVDFSIDMEQYFMHSNSFLDERLLHLIEKNFGILNSAITIYNNNKFSGGIAINAGRRLKGPYRNYFYQRDVVATDITTRITQGNIRNFETIRATDVIPGSYDKSEYCTWLMETASIKYVAVAPIPYHNFRLCFYRSEYENDFTNNDLKVISLILKMVASKYQSYQQIKDIQAINLLKNKFLDTSSTGIILMNNDFAVIDCNRAAVEILNRSENDDILSFFSHYIKKQSSDHVPASAIALPKRYNLPKDTSVHFSTHVDLEGYNNIRKYYLITLKNKEASLIQKDNTFMQLYKLSPREVEIIELLSRGLKYQEIADQLFISLNTARTHLKNIYAKLGVDNQRALLYLYNSHYQA